MSPKVQSTQNLNATPFGNRVSTGIIKLRWGHTGFRVGPNPMTGASVMRWKFGWDKHNGEMVLKTQGECHMIEMMLLQAKEC